MNLSLAVVYFLFNCGPLFIKENREFKEKLNALQDESDAKFEPTFA